jgi:uncharacterized tellurite resistance protein B-like protein
VQHFTQNNDDSICHGMRWCSTRHIGDAFVVSVWIYNDFFARFTPQRQCSARTNPVTIGDMLSPLKTLLAQFFNLAQDRALSVSDEHGLQLATAVLLLEVMRSDSNISDTERRAAVLALRGKFALTDDEMEHLLVQAERSVKNSNDYFHYTSAINEHFTHAQKIQVVEHMWDVAYADGVLDAHENHVISKVAGLLHVTHGEYIAAKLHAKQTAGLP